MADDPPASEKMLSSSLRMSRVPCELYGLFWNTGVGQRVVEEQLARVDDLVVDVHLHVDVDGAALVPAGVDGVERRGSVGVRELRAPQERCAGASLNAGVLASGVAMPDVDGRVLDRRALRRVDDVDRQASGAPAFPSVMS